MAIRTAMAAALICVAGSANAGALDLSGWYGGASISISDRTKIDHQCGYWWCRALPLEPSGSAYSGGLFIGHNFFHGPMMFGLELSARSDFSSTRKTAASPIFTQEYPALIGSGWMGGGPHSGSMYFEYEGGILQEQRSLTYSYRETITPTLSFRAGYQVNDWIVYGRVGGGISQISETLIDDDSNSIYCSTTRARYDFSTGGNFLHYLDDCLDPYSGSTRKSKKSTVLPIAVLAIGFEKHFDHMFLRGEAELRHAFANQRLRFSNAQGITTYSVSLGGGIRF